MSKRVILICLQVIAVAAVIVGIVLYKSPEPAPKPEVPKAAFGYDNIDSSGRVLPDWDHTFDE